MKKLIAVILLFLLFLASCGNEAEEKKDTTAAPDWRNLIEYEGSFYVDRETKLLYAADTGKVTLWDNGGDGRILQEIEYDTLASDAVDRMETDDADGDGKADIRIIYREADGVSTYNLWLWSENDEKFFPCRDYREIPNPENRGDGTVVGTLDLDEFGILETVYGFDGKGGAVPQSFVITNADEIASKISEALFPGDIKKGDGKATVGEDSCPVYVIRNGDSAAYLAYSEKGEWFCDAGCIGVYRAVLCENGAYTAGAYVGEAGSVCDTVSKLGGSPANITEVQKGTVDTSSAVMYTLSDANGKTSFAVTVKGGLWYYSEDGESYSVLISGDASLGDKVTITFCVPTDAEETTAEE